MFGGTRENKRIGRLTKRSDVEQPRFRLYEIRTLTGFDGCRGYVWLPDWSARGCLCVGGCVCVSANEQM